MPTYVPKEYWLNRGKIYRQQYVHNKQMKLQEKMLINYLKTISAFHTVLEVGCGFGRITKLILENFSNVTEYLAIDLSPDQVEAAKHYVGGAGVHADLKFIVSEIQSLDICKKYDLVLSCEVLLHIVPEEIESIMSKLVGLTSKHLVNLDWYEDPVPKQFDGTWNFVHQYQSLYQKSPLIRHVKRIPIIKNGIFGFNVRQSIFHATVDSLQ